MSDAVRDDLLRLAWSEVRAWTPDNLANLPAASRAIAAGADPMDLARAMNAAAYEAVFALLFVLDEGGNPHGDEPSPPAWAVVSLPDGQPLDGLHEDVLSADPTGLEGADLGE
jgi:hypothetical protein